jgi:predicted 3-demethylubiquinone-9 3-methyltransferase (glyoxalase superfamily)
MFSGKAEEAMTFYMSLFEQSSIVSITRYGADEGGIEGTVLHSIFSLNGQEFMCIDSAPTHAFAFTPAMSLYVQCNTVEEIDRLFNELFRGGKMLMPLATYPFSKKFGWVSDKYGVSWQLNLAK